EEYADPAFGSFCRRKGKNRQHLGHAAANGNFALCGGSREVCTRNAGGLVREERHQARHDNSRTREGSRRALARWSLGWHSCTKRKRLATGSRLLSYAVLTGVKRAMSAR